MMLNPFSTDAFNMTALTAAINKIPNTYGRLEQLNLMTPQGFYGAPPSLHGEAEAKLAALIPRP